MFPPKPPVGLPQAQPIVPDPFWPQASLLPSWAWLRDQFHRPLPGSPCSLPSPQTQASHCLLSPSMAQTTDRVRGEPGFRRIASTRNLCSSYVGFLAEEEARGNRAWRGQSHDHLRTPGITKAPQGGSGAPALVSDTFWASPRDLAFCLPPSVSRTKVGWGPLPTLTTPPFWRVQSPKGTRKSKV